MKNLVASVLMLGLCSLAFANSGSVTISVINNPHPNSVFFGFELYKDGSFVDKHEISNGQRQYNAGNTANSYPLNINLIAENPSNQYNVQVTADPNTCGPVLTQTCQSPYNATPNCVNMVWNLANQTPIPYSLNFVFTYTNSSNDTLNFTVSCYAH